MPPFFLIFFVSSDKRTCAETGLQFKVSFLPKLAGVSVGVYSIAGCIIVIILLADQSYRVVLRSRELIPCGGRLAVTNFYRNISLESGEISITRT
jgi:hypothetical protein